MFTFTRRFRLLTAGALLALVAACTAPPPPPPPTPVKITGPSAITCSVGNVCTGQFVGTGGVPATYAWSMTATPPFATFTLNANTQAFTGTPTFQDFKNSPEVFTINLTDGNSSTSLTVSVTITPPQSLTAPTISGTPSTTATVGQPYDFTPTASDTTNTPLVFGASGLPGWLSINAATGELTGTPQASDVGTDSGIVITVTDGYNLSASLAAFDIVVSAAVVAPPPPITVPGSGPSNTAPVGQPYSFQFTISDPQNRVWVFQAANLPVWANFNAQTGTISGTPLYEFLNQQSSGIAITATTTANGGQVTAPFVFSVTVTAPQPGYLASAPTPNAGPDGQPTLPMVNIQPTVLNGIASNGQWTLYASASLAGQNAEFNLVGYVPNAQPTQIPCASAIGCLAFSGSFPPGGTPSFTSLQFNGTGSFAGPPTNCVVNYGNSNAPAQPTTLTAAVSPAAPVSNGLFTCDTVGADHVSVTGHWQVAYSVSPYNANFVDLSIIATNLNLLQQALQVVTLDYAVDQNGQAALIGAGQINSNGGGTLQFVHN